MQEKKSVASKVNGVKNALFRHAHAAAAGEDFAAALRGRRPHIRGGFTTRVSPPTANSVVFADLVYTRLPPPATHPGKSPKQKKTFLGDGTD